MVSGRVLRARGLRPSNVRAEWSHSGLQAAFTTELIHRRKIFPAVFRDYLSIAPCGETGADRLSAQLPLRRLLNIDIAPDGTVCGIELLNANEQLGAGDGGMLVVIDEALGDRRELPLAR